MVDETRGLQVGDTVELFTAVDTNDSLFKLSDALENGPVVVVFYRGQWCPYCNRHLSALQDSMEQIVGAGATVIAISPENQNALNKTMEKNNISFTLLYDKDYTICTSFDVLFEPTNGQINKYNTFLNANLKEAHSQEEVLLPVPATFIIGTDGVIKWRQFDHNYKERSTVQEIIKHL